MFPKGLHVGYLRCSHVLSLWSHRSPAPLRDRIRMQSCAMGHNIKTHQAVLQLTLSSVYTAAVHAHTLDALPCKEFPVLLHLQVDLGMHPARHGPASKCTCIVLCRLPCLTRLSVCHQAW